MTSAKTHLEEERFSPYGPTMTASGTERFRSLLSKLAGTEGRVLLPSGEGGAKRRMRVYIPAILRPHPALRATLSRRERDTSETGRHTRGRSETRVGIGYTPVTTS